MHEQHVAGEGLVQSGEIVPEGGITVVAKHFRGIDSNYFATESFRQETGGLSCAGRNIQNRHAFLDDALVDAATLQFRHRAVDEIVELHLREFLGDLDGPFQIISRWKNIVLNGLSGQYFYDTIHTIKTISAEEIRELANKYLQPDDFYELVVLDYASYFSNIKTSTRRILHYCRNS